MGKWFSYTPSRQLSMSEAKMRGYLEKCELGNARELINIEIIEVMREA